MIKYVVMLCFGAVVMMAADEAVTGTLDYKDGNRVTGKLVAPGVFMSDRFGQVLFDAEKVEFVPAETGVSAVEESKVRAAAAQVAVASPKPASGRWLEPWKFSLAGFVDRRHEGASRESTYDFSFKAERPRLDGNRVLTNFSYQYVDKADRIDKRRATLKGEWDRDLSSRWLFLYRPEFEYDGQNLNADESAAVGRSRLNYGLMQQQAGFGYRVLDTARYKTNVSVNWVYLYLHVFHYGDLEFNAPVLLVENELQLPWKLSLKQSAKAYFFEGTLGTSFSNEMELKKTITDLFYLALRHEYRIDFVQAANELDRVRFFFGLDF
ncbi:DUF481 domain-containing protein [Oleiharenicola lentus]|uniref:DUF481 domain-containing protein n=1 Tax=Oleiharenicola lentus TaxID=2508720 RepID=UPI003F675A0B